MKYMSTEDPEKQRTRGLKQDGLLQGELLMSLVGLVAGLINSRTRPAV